MNQEITHKEKIWNKVAVQSSSFQEIVCKGLLMKVLLQMLLAP